MPVLGILCEVHVFYWRPVDNTQSHSGGMWQCYESETHHRKTYKIRLDTGRARLFQHSALHSQYTDICHTDSHKTVHSIIPHRTSVHNYKITMWFYTVVAVANATEMRARQPLGRKAKGSHMMVISENYYDARVDREWDESEKARWICLWYVSEFVVWNCVCVTHYIVQLNPNALLFCVSSRLCFVCRVMS